MAGQLPSVYDDILKKLNAMGGNFELISDPMFHDRVTFRDIKTKKKLSLNLTNASVDNSRVWLVGSDLDTQQKVVGPRITADRQSIVGEDYTSDVANIAYSATSSSGMLASMIYQSFNRTGRSGDPARIFNNLLSKGDKTLGIRPAPSIPRGYKATQNISLGQIDFQMTSGGKHPNPDESYEIMRDFQAQQANAFNPAFPVKSIANDASMDARELSFQYLNRGHYIPNEHGRLEPIAGTNINAPLQASGQWLLNTKPKTIAKSNKLSFGSDPATPFQIIAGVPTPLTARPTTNTARPAYAMSNVLMPGEESARGYERQSFVFDNFAVPGAAIAYNDPNDVKADFWGTDSIVRSKVASLNMNKLLSGEQKLDFAPIGSRTHGGGRPISVLGRLTTAGQEKPENILGRFGPGNWRLGGSREMILPAYVNPVSGEFASEQRDGYVETSGFREQLQGALPGTMLKFGRVSSPTLNFAGVNESSTSMKGLQIKASEIFTGENQEVNGQRVTRFTGELKGNAFLYGYFGGLSYNQIMGMAKDWGKLKKDNGLGKQVATYLQQNYGGAARQGRELNIDFNQMATDLGYEGGNGLGLLNAMFTGVIRSARPGGTRNQRNIEQYGAGYASGSLSLGVVHQDQLEQMRENFRRANPGMSPKKADALFNKTFAFTPHGEDRQGRSLYMGSQNLSKSAMFINMLAPRRVENIHGPRMTQDWIQAVTNQYPEFARQIGANLDTFQPQGATQSAAAGILKYALWQGSRRDDIASGSAADQMPTNYQEISDEQLSAIQSELTASAAAGASPIDQLRGVVNKYFPEQKGVSADALLYNKTLNQFIMNPRAALNSTFKELGTEAAGLARPMVGLLSRLGGIVNDYDLSRQEKIQEGLEASEGLQSESEDLITGSGEFFKRLLGTNIRSAVSGRTGGALNLANDEARITFDLALSTAKQMGFSGREAIAKAKQIMSSGASYVSARQPMGRGAVESRDLITEEQNKRRYASEEAYENVRSDPRARGQIDVPYSWGASEIGDFDRDPISGALGLNRVGDELKTIEDLEVRGDVMTAEKIRAIEEGIFPNEGMRNLVNANVKQLTDFAAGKDVVGSALAQKQSYSPQEVLKTAWERLMNKTLGMGVGYNPRRAVGGAMSASGYSPQEMANVMSSMPGMYQPALDTALTGREASGVAAASLIARPYFHLAYPKTGKEGEKRDRLLRVAMTGTKPNKYTRIETPEGTRIMPGDVSPKYDLNLDKMLGSKNPQELLDFGRFISEGFSRGYSLEGKKVGMSAKQYAGWFAAPGDAEALEKQLPEDTAQWSNVVHSYQSRMIHDVVNQGGTYQQGMERVLSTPAMMSVFTRAVSKAINRRNPLTGKEQIEGANQGWGLIKNNMSPDFINRLTTAVASHDVEHRAKGLNLRALHPRNLATAASTIGNDVKGRALRMLTRIMDVPFGPTATQNTTFDERVQAERDEVDQMFGGQSQTDTMQNILDSMTRGIPLTEDQNAYMARLSEEGQRRAQPTESRRRDSEDTPEQESTNQPAGGDPLDEIMQQRQTPWQETVAGYSDQTPSGGEPPRRGKPPSGGGPPSDDDDDYTPRWKDKPSPKREGYHVRAAHARAMRYNEKAPSAVSYMDKVLTKLGYKPGFKTPKGQKYQPRAGDVRDRFERAFVDDRETLLSSISSKMRKQLERISMEQKDTATALWEAGNATGLGLQGSQIQEELSAAVAPGSKLGDDITAFASYKDMVGDAKPKNEFVLQDALELAGEKDFKRVYKALQPVMGGRGGIRGGMKQLRQILAGQPEGIEMLRLSKAMSTENITGLPEEVSRMGSFAKAVEKRDPDLLKRGGTVTELPTKQIEELNRLYKEQAEAATKLKDAQEKKLVVDRKELEQLEFEAKKTNAAYRGQLYGTLATDTQQRMKVIHDKFGETGTLTSAEKKNLRLASGELDRYRKGQMDALQESEGYAEEEQVGKMGMAARRMLGGFGLMYMRSILGFATSGLGYGTEQRLAYNQVQQGALYQSTGIRNVQQNQEQILQNKMSLAGSNYDAIAGVRQVFADAPVARDVYNMGAAGIGAWGYSQFAADQLKHTSLGRFLGKNAAGIGVAAASISMFADSYARAQDPVSLGQRLESGKAGPSDWLSHVFLNEKTAPQVSRSRAAMALSNVAGERGLTFEQMQNTQVEFVSGVKKNPLAWLGVGVSKTTGLAGEALTKSEMFGANMAYLQDKNLNLAPEAVATAAAFQMRNNISLSDKRLTAIAEDKQFGGWAEQTATQALSGLGYSPNQMYARESGAEFDKLGSLQMRLATGTYNEAQRANMQAGIQALSQIQGAKYIEGVGSKSTSQVTDEKIDKFIEVLGKIADSAAGQTFMAEQNASYAARQAGMSYQAPNINQFVDANGNPIQMSEQEAQRRQSQAQAFTASANTRIATAQGFSQYAYNIGQDALAQSGYAFLMGGNRGDQWRRNRAINADPMMLATMAMNDVNLSEAPGARNIQGRMIDANYLANTDISADGRVTGLNWGSTSLRRGNISAEQMGRNIFGDMDNIGTRAMIQGVKLPHPIKLADGTVVSSVAGQMGLQMQGDLLDQQYQEQMMGFQQKGMNRDYAYQMKLWGLQDQQRALGHQHQMSMFGFQEQGMQLQNQQMEMNNRFFWQNTGLQQQQMQMQRGWTRQDWAFNAETRAMQWGWNQEDFQENRRFMTGRDRRLAERQMERETTMHDREGEQIERQKNRQEELWKLEDARFALQKAQHTEQFEMQKKQMELQRQQFEENKKFYLESKKIEDEIIKLQRQHWLEEHKAAKEQLKATQEHQKAMLELKKASDQSAIAMQLLNGQMNTLVEDSLAKFQDWITGLRSTSFSAPTSNVAQMVGNSNPTAGGGFNSGNLQTVNANNQSSSPSRPTNTNTFNWQDYYNMPALTGSGGSGRAAGGETISSFLKTLKTGERGWEFLVGNEVIPHEISVEMERRGVGAGSPAGQARDMAERLMSTPSFSVDSITPQVVDQRQPRPSSKPIHVHVYVGNHELKSFITQAVGEEF